MLTVESLREHCRTKPGSRETFPFDLRTLVFKVAGKMYALCGIDGDPLELSLKCAHDEAEALRSAYLAVKLGYHLNKRHWNTAQSRSIDEVAQQKSDTGLIATTIKNVQRWIEDHQPNLELPFNLPRHNFKPFSGQ